MDPEFNAAIAAILVADHAALEQVLAETSLATARSSCSHPTLLQLVACEAKNLRDPLGSARVLIDAGAALQEPLVAAASVDAREVLRLLLDHGADLNASPWGPLQEALYWGHLELALELTARGALPITLAALSGLGDISGMVRMLEDPGRSGGPIRSPFQTSGISDDAQDILDHALVMAAMNGQRESAGLLIIRGARPDAIPPGIHWCGTALHAAAWRGDQAMALYLLERGADPTIRDSNHNSQADGWARHHQFLELAAVLEAHRLKFEVASTAYQE